MCKVINYIRYDVTFYCGVFCVGTSVTFNLSSFQLLIPYGFKNSACCGRCDYGPKPNLSWEKDWTTQWLFTGSRSDLFVPRRVSNSSNVQVSHLRKKHSLPRLNFKQFKLQGDESWWVHLSSTHEENLLLNQGGLGNFTHAWTNTFLSIPSWEVMLTYFIYVSMVFKPLYFSYTTLQCTSLNLASVAKEVNIHPPVHFTSVVVHLTCLAI